MYLKSISSPRFVAKDEIHLERLRPKHKTRMETGLNAGIKRLWSNDIEGPQQPRHSHENRVVRELFTGTHPPPSAKGVRRLFTSDSFHAGLEPRWVSEVPLRHEFLRLVVVFLAALYSPHVGENSRALWDCVAFEGVVAVKDVRQAVRRWGAKTEDLGQKYSLAWGGDEEGDSKGVRTSRRQARR